MHISGTDSNSCMIATFPLLLLCFKTPQFSCLKKWSVFGPFPVAKSEIDAEPWELKGPLYSEYIPAGRKVSHTILRASSSGEVSVEWNGVDWQRLASSAGMEALSWQALAETSLRVKIEGTYLVSCFGVTHFWIKNLPLVGDLYRTSQISTSVFLTEGKYPLKIRLRGRHSLKFGCRAERASELLRVLDINKENAPDLPHLDLIGNVKEKRLVIPVYVQNLGSTRNISVGASDLPPYLALVTKSVILPVVGQIGVVPVLLGLTSGCEQKGVIFGFALLIGGISHYVRLTCRSRLQSFVFTFPSHDGSWVPAAAIPPRSCRRDCPVILTLHGTSIACRDSADAYKFVPVGGSDFVFGHEEFWVLASTKHGAHNWEGPGTDTAISALGALFSKFGDWVDASRVVVAGHSMGGHGALLAAAFAPDWVIGVAASAFWLRKERYGDENTRFKWDVQTPDPWQKFLASSGEESFSVDSVSGNFRGVPVMLRGGAEDRVVDSYLQRRLFRIMRSQGLNVTFSEIQGQGHWWWDTERPNDGGALFDREMRSFFDSLAKVPSRDCSDFTLTAFDATDLYTGICGMLPISMARRGESMQLKGKIEGNGHVIKVSTHNVVTMQVSLSRFPAATRISVDFCTADLDKSSQIVTHVLLYQNKAWSSASISFICSHDGVKLSNRTLSPLPRTVNLRFPIVIESGPDTLEAAVFLANMYFMTGYVTPDIRSPREQRRSSLENVIALIIDSKLDKAEFETKHDQCLEPICPVTLTISGPDLDELQSAVAFLSAPALPPMARQPFSHLLPPGRVILEKGFKGKGLEAFRVLEDGLEEQNKEIFFHQKTKSEL